MKRVLFLSLVLLSVATIVHSCKKESPQDAQVTEIIFKNVDGNLNMFVGETFKVRYDIVPEELEDIAQITWQSSKKSSCAVTAAAQLSPLVDWADLDGNLLISNDCFVGLKIVEGKVTLPDSAGIGVTPL